MTTFYIILVAMLLVLALFDLFVGVSNDAVNFLSSAVGSKAFKYKTLMIFAAVGVFCGATFSSGMMDIARHGIYMPQYYTFAELMCVYAAVMFTDVILLDIFNSYGMPTSTTVSMVFELLGASVAIASIKILGDDSLALGNLINTSKALTVIMGIFLSVAIAFVVGLAVQYVTRLIFSFGYKKKLRYFVGIFGSVSLTSIFYFILVKGLKNMSFVGEGYKTFLSENEMFLIMAMFVGFFAICHLLHAVGVNVLKVIIAFGTFSLALAFAGNDLVNFVGVPLTSLSSMQHLLSDSGNPLDYNMSFLLQSEPGQWYLLMIAGLIMVLSLVFSKKAKNVVKTSVSLAAQNSSDEIFGTNPVARALVRGSNAVVKFVSSLVPRKISNKLNSRFNTKQMILEEEGAAFDLLRACVNLMLASSLIALGTSLKLPLSTTYVTFMVAMGTSLADRAWNRETAVYRITGVLSVIGGWFLTAFAAFASASVVATVLHLGGLPVIFALFAVVIFVLVRSNLKYRENKKDKTEERFEKILAASPESKVYPLIQDYSRGEWSEILRWCADCYEKLLVGLLREDLGELRSVNKKVKILKKHVQRNRRHGTLCTERLAQEDLVVKNFFLYQANDFMGDALFSLEQISSPCKNHVDNGFSPMDKEKRKKLLRVAAHVRQKIEYTADMVESMDFSCYDDVRNQLREEGSKIFGERKAEMMKASSENIRAEILYLTILYESWALLDSVGSVAKASRKFLTVKQ